MAVQFSGIVAEDFTTNSDFIDLVLDAPVPRSSPTTGQFVAVVVQATGAETIGFGGNIYSAAINDDAPEQPCYADLYGVGNKYLRVNSYPRAGSVTLSLKFNWMQVWFVCVLHPLAINDKITVSFDTSDVQAGVMDEIRGYVFRLSGITADPAPFTFVGNPDASIGWNQGRVYAWNTFDTAAGCFDGSYDAAGIGGFPGLFVTKELQSDEYFFGSNHWANPAPFALTLLTGAYQPSLSSFTWADAAFTTVNEWYADGPADMMHVMGYGEMTSPPAVDSTKFGGCFNTTPSFLAKATPIEVVPRLLQAGAGSPYANPGACGGPFIHQKFKQGVGAGAVDPTESRGPIVRLSDHRLTRT
jgi:hypothetical protein